MMMVLLINLIHLLESWKKKHWTVNLMIYTCEGVAHKGETQISHTI